MCEEIKEVSDMQEEEQVSATQRGKMASLSHYYSHSFIGQSNQRASEMGKMILHSDK